MTRRTAVDLYNLAEAARSGETHRLTAATLDRAGDAHMREVEAAERTRRAVMALQAAWWTADRPCNGDALWTELRRSVGLEP
jgi:hypothetical protein